MNLELALQPDPSRLTWSRLCADACARHTDRTAFRFQGESWRYSRLADEVQSFAAALLARGVGRGTHVALLMANRPEWAVASFAVASLGAVVIPVNTFATPRERDYILRHADAALLIVQSQLLKHRFIDDLVDAHPEIATAKPGALRCAALPQLRRLIALGPHGLLDAREARGAIEAWPETAAPSAGDARLLDAIEAELDPSDDGFIIYTSGTTALPKAILHPQQSAAIQSYRFAEYLGHTPDDVVYTAQPFFWTAGIAQSLGATLAAGARLVLAESFEPGEALALIEAERVTCPLAWPHQDKAMAEHPEAAQRDLSSARKVEFASPLGKLVGLEKDEWGMYGSYGLSETFTIASAIPCTAPAELRAKTSGVALPGMELRIVDPMTGEPTDGHGEITVRGATLMRGYYKQPREAAFDAAGFFHTQDGGEIDDTGYLHWTGRLSNLIKTGGANVSPLEIDHAALDIPGVQAALAVGVPHPQLGEAIVLCALRSEGHAPDASEVRRVLRERLAAYKVPKLVLFFEASEIEFTGNQKIQLGPLREAALARLAREGIEIDGHPYESPERNE